MAAEYEDEISVNPPKIDGYADILYIKSGLYGDVFSATTTDGSKYAIKSMDLKNASLIEIDLMMHLNHVNIIRGGRSNMKNLSSNPMIGPEMMMFKPVKK